MESAQLRASSAFLPYVIHVSTCFMCLRALCALLVYMPSCLCIIRALIFSRAWHAILFYVLYIPSIFYVPHVSAFFYLFYLPSFFTWLHFFKFFEFLTCLMCLLFFIKCGTIHNYPQQAGMSKKKEQPKKTPGNIGVLFSTKYSCEYFFVLLYCESL